MDGDTAVTVTGVGLTGATAVHFGSEAATNVVVASDTQITATSPTGNLGRVDITVVTPSGTSATSPADQFTYFLPPPTATVATPSAAQSGDVAISYSLVEAASDPCNIQVQYSSDAGATWYTATAGSGGEGTMNLAASPTGTAHTFVWNSFADLGNTANASVQIRVVPINAEGPGTVAPPARSR